MDSGRQVVGLGSGSLEPAEERAVHNVTWRERGLTTVPKVHPLPSYPKASHGKAHTEALGLHADGAQLLRGVELQLSVKGA